MSDRGHDTTRRDRRRFLATAGGAGAVLLAGCTSEFPTGGLLGGDDDSEPMTPSGTNEADVTSLVLNRSGNQVTFDVTVENRGETGHVDWWQIEKADDTVGNENPLVRHETEVTDSETAAETINSSDANVVVVRAHHTEGGYGGKAILVKLSGQELKPANQGRDPSPQGDASFGGGILPF